MHAAFRTIDVVTTGPAAAAGSDPCTSCRTLAKEVLVSVLAWIVLGLIAGFVASKLVSGSGEGVLLDIILGIVGAVAGGWLFNRFGMAGVTGLNLYSLLVAIVGAALLLIVYHAVTRGSR
jgi:uncharacterized membrane protein YeaQ/YmgE (transglycosylase-associated protein family)